MHTYIHTYTIRLRHESNDFRGSAAQAINLAEGIIACDGDIDEAERYICMSQSECVYMCVCVCVYAAQARNLRRNH